MFRRNIIYLIVVLIGALLVSNVVLTYYNNSIIRKNQDTHIEVESAKLYYDQIGKVIIHALDIGLRGYAIIKDKKFIVPFDNAKLFKDSILTNLEIHLQRLNYDFAEYNVFKDSLNAYEAYCSSLRDLLVQGRTDEFAAIFKQDKGAYLWAQYVNLEKNIFQYTNNIDTSSQKKYELALFRNQVIQIILFIICFPTLLYTAFFTRKTVKLTELLHVAEADKNKMLQEQNLLLESKVSERTQEITAQNEEIIAQSDVLSMQNRQLQEAQKIIELQHAEIQAMNDQLRIEVDSRTVELSQANKELIAQNNQLEQFAYMAAHNLRAPLTRILGLANLIPTSQTAEEREVFLQKLIASSKDLDQVIWDLNGILNINKLTANMVEVELGGVLDRVKNRLEKEIDQTQTVITCEFDEGNKVFGVASYVESILYNLISNAIKYRDLERIPWINVETTHDENFICLSVSDNGLGIDLAKHREKVFNLYKRFHLHMEGRGLGLYLVKTQVQAMGGKIEVMSEPNEGTTFMVYFRRYLI